MKKNKAMHLLSELTERVTRDMRRAAINAYLDGDLHRQLLIGGALVEQCVESRRKLLKGEISPHLDICCCGDTFTTILTDIPFVSYKGCGLPEEDDYTPGDDGVWRPETIDSQVDSGDFDRLSRLSAVKLRERLVNKYDCTVTEYGQMHKDDEKLQREYYEAVFSRFEAAAQHAKAIGSGSARLWLEALCLIQPRTRLANSANVKIGLDLDPDCVAEAYEVAERAQRMLWVDSMLGRIPAAKLPRKAASRRR